ncbi:TIGR03089 family protein [Paractinoplanes lichenicola]|uniref:AMP-dependent synthetase n=1 Tax=Paractinoplanes lichenicola TaxID=2802976 RepID=A0ABS1W4T5_9ACTN|nr:TIGR03089 family protein [Actinoplanes lichenicola]MBL7261729.1 AMP-dependent synthetase [Actinoplanes lichenicola]
MTAGDLITYYDDRTGERFGLTAGELGGWTAATSALLTEGCGLGPGDTAAVLLPPHWQTAAVLLGAWSAGIELSIRGWATAGLTPAGDPLDVTFVERRRIGNWLDEVPSGRHQFVLGLAPHGEATGDVPDGYRDYTSALRPHLGVHPPRHQFQEHLPAVTDGTSYREYAQIAAALAERNGIRAGDRVLIDTTSQEQPLIWLLGPLSVGASIVLCANLDATRLDQRIAHEGVTKVL